MGALRAGFKLWYSFQGFTHKLFDFKGVREGFAVQMVQLKEKITVIFFQKKTEKRKLYFKWKDAKKQGRRRNDSRLYTLDFLSAWNLSLLFFYWFLFLEC